MKYRLKYFQLITSLWQELQSFPVSLLSFPTLPATPEICFIIFCLLKSPPIAPVLCFPLPFYWVGTKRKCPTVNSKAFSVSSTCSWILVLPSFLGALRDINHLTEGCWKKHSDIWTFQVMLRSIKHLKEVLKSKIDFSQDNNAALNLLL